MISKLNDLLKQWPKGTVATASWLQEHGVYRQLARRYALSGWIQSIGRGAFLRSGDTVEWFGGVYALQTQLALKVHVGASTALLLKGLGHFLPLGKNAEVCLLSECRERLPAWFTRYAWDVRMRYASPRFLETSDPAGFTEVKHGDFSVRVSAPERAILEVLHEATTNDAIDHAVELMDGLGTLRPQVVQSLLEGCRSVKVKRLFLWAAESAGHQWLSRVAVECLDMGKGKRRLYRGGQLNTKYGITVPKREAANV